MEYFHDFRVSLDADQRLEAIAAAIGIDSVRQLDVLLAKNPVLPEYLDQAGTSPLHLAAASGALRSFHYLHQRGARLDAIDRMERSVLEVAIDANHPTIIKHILHVNGKMDWTKKGSKGRPYLDLACDRGSVEIAAILLEAGAPINEKNPQGLTPLHVAVTNGNRLLAHLLLAAGCDVTVRYGTISAMEMVPPSAPELRSLLEQYGDARRAHQTVLHTAIRRDDQTHFPLLLRMHDVNIPNADGVYPLHAAVFSQNLILARMLVEAGAALEFIDKEGRTPLYVAIDKADRYILAMLLRAGVSPNAKNCDGKYPLEMAVERHLQDIVKTLVFYKADPQLCSKATQVALASLLVH